MSYNDIRATEPPYPPPVNQDDYDALAEIAAHENARRVHAEARLAEHDRLHADLNAVLHPNGDGPAAPSLCDLVAYVRADKARLAEAERLLFHAKDLTPHPGKFFEAEVLRQRIDALMETTGSASGVQE
jgi:hypothetical protein